jgi:hypothetical protein
MAEDQFVIVVPEKDGEWEFKLPKYINNLLECIWRRGYNTGYSCAENLIRESFLSKISKVRKALGDLGITEGDTGTD